MKVEKVFTRDAAIIGPNESLTFAAENMREHRCGFLVVVEPGFENQLMPIGVLSDRDIVNCVVAREADSRSLRVADAMTRMPLIFGLQDDLNAAIPRMRKLGVRRVPVVGGSGELLGLLSLDAVVDALTEGSRPKRMREWRVNAL